MTRGKQPAAPTRGADRAGPGAAEVRRETARDPKLVGAGLVLLATLAWSLGGLFTRALATDVWTAIAWRSLFGGLFLLVPCLLLNRGKRLFGLAIGKAGFLLAACQVICHACTVGAFYFTTVANVAVIYATAPFIAAMLARWLFGEAMRPRTMLAALVCLVGVLVIAVESVAGGHALGDLLALGMTLSFAFVIVIPRMRRDVPMLPTTVVSALAAFALFAPLSSPATVTTDDWIVLAAFGFTNFVLALFLFLLGARRIPSAEAALIGTLEIVLAPFWVWLVFAERPTDTALAGSGLILAAVVVHAVLDVLAGRSRRLTCKQTF